MPRIVKTIRNGVIVEFDRGGFDEWCVYVAPPHQPRFAPRDAMYFTRLADLGDSHGKPEIYEDFVKIYTAATATIDAKILENISKLSSKYDDDDLEIDQWFTVLYAGMVAEENKHGSVLGKRIKRLGIHQVLIDNEKPEIAANYSRNKKWRVLDQIMREKGF